MKNDALTQIQKLGIETSIDPTVLDLASRDASLFHVQPEVVVTPRSEDELRQIVNIVATQKASQPTLSVTARSAGTDMSGGPLTESMVINMTKHFNNISSVDKKTKTAVVEPGVFYKDFEKQTLEHNLFIPSYPASRELCTVGGMVANNSGGEKTLAYGKTEKYVKSLRVVLSDGSVCTFSKITKQELSKKKELDTLEGAIYRDIETLIKKNLALIQFAKPDVSKNSAGYALWNVYDPEEETYDLAQLIVGSQGTLGLITEIELALIEPKPHARMLVVMLPNMKRVAEVTQTILKHAPESFESYDDHTLAVALKVLPALIKKMKGNLLKLAFQFLPEAWMTLTGGLPKLVLIAEFTAQTEAQAQKMAESAHKDMVKLGAKSHVTHSEEEDEKYWTIRRESFSLLREHVKELRTAPFIDDFVVHPDQLSDFLPELYNILNPYKLVLTVAGHVGDANFHIIPLMDTNKPETRQIIEELSKKVYDLVLRYHGSITGEHNDGLIRTPFLEQMYGKDVCALFTQIKKIFDPKNIFNPGKKVNGNFKYAMDHLDVLNG